MIYIVTILASILLTYLITLKWQKIWIAYIVIPASINFGIYLFELFRIGFIDPFIPMGMLILTIVAVISVFIFHMFWLLHGIHKGRNITHINDLD